MGTARPFEDSSPVTEVDVKLKDLSVEDPRFHFDSATEIRQRQSTPEE